MLIQLNQEIFDSVLTVLDSAKKSTADAIKTASKRAIQKIVEPTGDLISNKIADKKNLHKIIKLIMK